MEIQVTETHPPGAGRKMGTVVTADGQRFNAYPEMLANIQIGRRYAVKTESWDNKGRTYHKIIEASPFNGPAPAANGNGVAHSAGNGNGHAPAAGSVSTEAAFVREVLAALILKGDVVYTKKSLYDATQLLRGLYAATFGNRGNTNGGDDA